MRLTVNGDQYDLDGETVTSRLRGRTPEEIQTLWVEVGGTRFPVKQALEAVLGISRTTFNSRTAHRHFRHLGLPVSPRETTVPHRPSAPAAQPARPPISVEQAGEAFATLTAFLRTGPFTAGIGQLEHALVGADRDQVADVTATAGLTEQVLDAALVVRRDVGRVSDVIHAAVIALALPRILEPNEIVSNRPSLSAGNDKTRPFDLETNLRVAEFKVALWSGGDMMRKRGVTADLVHLALDESGRRPELWVAGTAPIHFLQNSNSDVGDLLSKASRHLRSRFEARYGTQAIPLRDFVKHHASHVQLLDITEALPAVGAALM